ncbi:hypothetical protein PaG_04400 [Moesziomyces aphidis]|uniref:DUF1748-domain-containing protein n=1 Tax=Moesziomyces aphidis TaxID=84754 RepID=W3VI78_MOEAP|nr:hypothetical protein PaG_04400 [Moesziomyces aphidis]
MFGRIFHLLFDAMLVSVALSGIKRSTGLTPAVSRMPNKDLRNLMRIYLEAGEWIMDFSVVILGRSSSFERKWQAGPDDGGGVPVHSHDIGFAFEACVADSMLPWTGQRKRASGMCAAHGQKSVHIGLKPAERSAVNPKEGVKERGTAIRLPDDTGTDRHASQEPQGGRLLHVLGCPGQFDRRL